MLKPLPGSRESCQERTMAKVKSRSNLGRQGTRVCRTEALCVQGACSGSWLCELRQSRRWRWWGAAERDQQGLRALWPRMPQGRLVNFKGLEL